MWIVWIMYYSFAMLRTQQNIYIYKSADAKMRCSCSHKMIAQHKKARAVTRIKFEVHLRSGFVHAEVIFTCFSNAQHVFTLLDVVIL